VAAFRVLQLLPGMGPAHSQRCLDEVGRERAPWATLARWRAPAAADPDWPALAGLMAALADSGAPWPGQVEQVRDWYRPHLERRYDAAAVRAGDLEQLAQIAGGYPSRERFLTELALDPAQASGNLSGPPLLDEDYLVLSTVHSAKGREWNSVYVLNVSDGNFPSEFATGRPDLIDEERRVLYVAMTRARDALHLISPLKYYVTQQSRLGDAHVYGAQSRFLTAGVRRTLTAVAAVPVTESDAARRAQPALDLGARMRALWD
jgi:DNA helicase-2/ATP-dependent DNA helicase PcrA